MNTLELEIFNQKLKIQSELSTHKAQAVLEIAQKKIKDVELRKKFKSTQDILMIALLELSNEYICSKNKILDYQKNIYQKVDELEKSLKNKDG